MRKTPLQKALELAIVCIDRVCVYYTARGDSARYGFEYGINAKKHHDEHQEAKRILQELLDEKTQGK